MVGYPSDSLASCFMGHRIFHSYMYRLKHIGPVHGIWLSAEAHAGDTTHESPKCWWYRWR